ncbi:alpha/beta hydrolase [Rhodopirellula sallentina]|uniref:Lipase, putative esterase n=1 Tax=Rhodopirellula sallentina SM41 TaxID=1263870 RepID=M5U6K7_9BACT|nr:alpha/beta hydrolase [Rhodopirellula sallentina]EMI53506.1 lipase, putative esterase [Rhodopirellula sallentina SM41]
MISLLCTHDSQRTNESSFTMKFSRSPVRLFALVAAVFAVIFYAEDCSAFEPDERVTYKTVGDVELQLHVFRPADPQPNGEAPAIVFFFGGGWNGGTPAQFYEQARRMADRGMVAFSADYRVRSRQKTTPFECVSDGKSAVRWIREHAATYGIDPQKIVASGGSAGGHVAACTGVIETLDEPSENAAISSIPNAMVLYNPVIDTTAKGYGLKRVGEDRETEISPCHHVREGLPPTLILHGTKDTTVPFENAERFNRLMNEAGNRCELVSFAGQGHGFFNSKSFRPKTKDISHYERAMKSTEQFLESLGYLDEVATE